MSASSTCSVSLQLPPTDSSSTQIGLHTLDCDTSTPAQFRPVVYLSFSSNSATAAVCTPTVVVNEVLATINLASGELVTKA